MLITKSYYVQGGPEVNKNKLAIEIILERSTDFLLQVYVVKVRCPSLLAVSGCSVPTLLISGAFNLFVEYF